MSDRPKSPSIFEKMKSILSSRADSPPQSTPGGGGPKIWPVAPEMQREFEKGVKYNMKVVIRGMRRTGKSALLAKLHGHPFSMDKYNQSSEISAATIRYCSSDAHDSEGVKVEIWDIVDEGIPPSASAKHPVKGAPQNMPIMVADASTVDVYRGCQCVIFMVDITRRETLEYVTQEVPRVPSTAAILVCMNFCDAPASAQKVFDKDVDDVCRKCPRATTPLVTQASKGQTPDPSLSIGASWITTSMASGVGLDALYTFLNIPVMTVKLATLEASMRLLYRSIEGVQGDLLAIRAQRIFEQKERERELSQEAMRMQPQSQQRVETSSGGSASKPQEAVRNETKFSSAIGAGINNSFFSEGGNDEMEAENEPEPVEQLSDEEELPPPPPAASKPKTKVTVADSPVPKRPPAPQPPANIPEEPRKSPPSAREEAAQIPHQKEAVAAVLDVTMEGGAKIEAGFFDDVDEDDTLPNVDAGKRPKEIIREKSPVETRRLAAGWPTEQPTRSTVNRQMEKKPTVAASEPQPLPVALEVNVADLMKQMAEALQVDAEASAAAGQDVQPKKKPKKEHKKHKSREKTRPSGNVPEVVQEAVDDGGFDVLE